MKSPLGLCLLALALLANSSAATSTRTANTSTHTHSCCAGLLSALPHPILHLRFSGAAMVLEFGYRPAGPRTVPPSQLVTLRFTLTESGRVELVLRSPNLWLALPRRSV
jgi:hypothetical protein